MDSADRAALLYLPDEVWSEVFSHLSNLDDRKSVRLTCRQFYEVCNSFRFQVNEEMVFHGNINSHTAILALSNSPRKLWNIRLNQVYRMGFVVLEIFRKKGPDIYSLTLDKCETGPGVLKYIIKYCSNLRSISLIFDRVIDENILNDFEGLVNDGIVREYVTSFTFKQEALPPHDETLTNKKFLRIFNVFPNIKNLDIRLVRSVQRRFDNFNNIFYDVTSDKKLSVYSIFHQIEKMRNQLENVTLHFSYDDDILAAYFLLQPLSKFLDIKIENLKELSLNWFDAPLVVSQINCITFKHLTHFKWTVRFILKASDLHFLLDNATALRSLIIKMIPYFSEIYLSAQCFHSLLKSKLATLKIYLVEKPFVRETQICPEQLESFHSSISNYTLKYLHLSTNYDLLPIFTERFLSLESLVVDEVTEGVLYHIFRYQKQLRTLVLHNLRESLLNNNTSKSLFSGVFNCWFRNEKLSSNLEFENLTHLYIVDEKSLTLINWMLNNIVLPNLQSLTVIVRCGIFERPNCLSFLWIIQKFTQLEYIYLDIESEIIFIPTFEDWFTLFCALPKLRYFYCLNYTVDNKYWERPFLDSEYRELFQMFPSLRSIVHNYMKYFNDILTNTVVCISFIHTSTDFQQFLFEGVPPYFYGKVYSDTYNTNFAGII